MEIKIVVPTGSVLSGGATYTPAEKAQLRQMALQIATATCNPTMFKEEKVRAADMYYKYIVDGTVPVAGESAVG